MTARAASDSHVPAARAETYAQAPPVAGGADAVELRRPAPALRARHRRFVHDHVYADRGTRRPVPLPDRIAAFVKALQ